MILSSFVEESKGRSGGMASPRSQRERNMKLALVCGLGGGSAYTCGESY